MSFPGCSLLFSIVMLNTELHDERLTTTQGARSVMTVDQFVRNLRGTNDKGDFPRPLLEVLYMDIKKQPIQWKGPGSSPELSLNNKKNNGGDSQVAERESRALQVRARARLRTLRPLHRSYYQFGPEPALARAIFQTIWRPLLVMLSGVVQRMRPFRPAGVTDDGGGAGGEDASSADGGGGHEAHAAAAAAASASCWLTKGAAFPALDALTCAMLLAVTYGMDVERQAFMVLLAQCTYKMQKCQNENLLDEVERYEHIKQDW